MQGTRRIWLIFWHEINMLTRRFSFWLAVLGVPLMGFLVYGGAFLINQHNAQPAEGSALDSPFKEVGKIFSPQEDERPQGYIDQGSLIQAFPADFPHKKWIAYSEATAAKKALEAGSIKAYYVISPDYKESGKITAVLAEYNLLATANHDELVDAINFNLLGQNAPLFKAVRQPISDLQQESTAPQKETARGPNDQFSLALAEGVMFLFFIGIMGSSTMLLNSLTNEKENLVIEVLMISSSPSELLMGKIAGLGAIGLLQTVIWLGSSLALLKWSGDALLLPVGLTLPPDFLAWGIVFYLLGYLIYAALMAGIGALVPNMREASQITTLVMLPLMVPLFFIIVITSEPNGVLAILLSLFPFTAPVAMMMRLSLDTVPLWQLGVSIALLAVTILLVIRTAAWLFRAQTIMSPKAYSVRQLLFALLHIRNPSS